MDTTHKQYKVALHYKDTWTDAKTGNLINSEYSTETHYRDTPDEINVLILEKTNVLESSVEHEGVKTTRVLVGLDQFQVAPRGKLTKEEMFDFILTNNVNINISNTLWQRTDGTKVRIKYDVAINDTKLCGMDLEEAIQYYHDNIVGRKN